MRLKSANIASHCRKQEVNQEIVFRENFLVMKHLFTIHDQIQI